MSKDNLIPWSVSDLKNLPIEHQDQDRQHPMMTTKFHIRQLVASEDQDKALLEQIIHLEAASYPSDEAADAQRICYRYHQANEFFVVALAPSENGDQLVGFVNGTLTASDSLEEETMALHDPQGTTLCIHSVVVQKHLRKQRLGTQLMQRYVELICSKCPRVQRMVLLAKAPLIAFYTSCGFQVLRESPVVHGHEKWFEMSLDCRAKRALPWCQVDAFTCKAFEGNPAAVVMVPTALFHAPHIEKWMLQVAKENNLSETAFVWVHEHQEDHQALHCDLRWFTPAVEVALCGHATLASALALLEFELVKPQQIIHFHTQKSGVLICTLLRDADGNHLVQMDFPLRPVGPQLRDSSGLVDLMATKCLGLNPQDVLAMHPVGDDMLVRVTPNAFERMKPVFDELGHMETRGVIVTCEAQGSNHGFDFFSRFFAPRVGVNEDPVTGSAHCGLASYWSHELAKDTLRARQQSARGGNVFMKVDIQRQRCLLQGNGCIVLRGTLAT